MKLCVDQKIFAAFDTPIIGVVVAQNINNQGDSQEVEGLLRAVEEQTRKEFLVFESHGEHPNIKAWRKTYKQFGSDPHQYRCSAEALVRRVLKGDSVPHINKLVDIYNYISVKHIVPVGGEDIDKIQGELRLAFADGAESFVRLNGTKNDSPEKGEVVYKDDKGVLCRRWNWREADRTKLTEDTRNAVIVIDALAPMDRKTVEEATNELANLIKKFCGGEISSEIMYGV